MLIMVAHVVHIFDMLTYSRKDEGSTSHYKVLKPKSHFSPGDVLTSRCAMSAITLLAGDLLYESLQGTIFWDALWNGLLRGPKLLFS